MKLLRDFNAMVEQAPILCVAVFVSASCFVSACFYAAGFLLALLLH